ncbi:MAG: HAMP domain-containing histidine kinase [Bdellovibrionales bacterium]|nr:HAMP domain-containing histidine kinase [Bdellovibrionales bacterium]
MLNLREKDKFPDVKTDSSFLKFCFDLSLTTHLQSFLLTVRSSLPKKFRTGEGILFYKCQFLGLRRAYIKKTSFYEQSVKNKWSNFKFIRFSNPKENLYLSRELGRPFFNTLIIPFSSLEAVLFLELEQTDSSKELIEFFQNKKLFLEQHFIKIYKSNQLHRSSYLWRQLFLNWKEPLAVLKDFKVLNKNTSFEKAISQPEVFFKKKQRTGCLKVKNKTYQLFYYPLSESLGLLYAQDMTKYFLLKGYLFQKSKMLELFKLGENMSHQLNNPLAGVKAMTQILNLNPKLADFQKEFQELEKAIERSQRIIESFLSFSKEKSEIKSCDLNEVIQNTFPLLKSMTKNIQLQINLYNKPLKVKGDFAILQQIVYNLILNACQALREDKKNLTPQLTITTDQISEDKVCVKVKDNGIGISEDHLDKIFQPLWTNKKKGTGFGLGITKKFVEKCKGNIFVSSQEKKQTCFTVILPLYHPKNLIDIIESSL